MFQWVDEGEWLEQRKKGIGGSEASMVMGINPWKSKLELWNEKVTQQANIDATKQLMFKIGHTLEPIIAEEYANETGRKLEERLKQSVVSKKNYLKQRENKRLKG